MEPRRCGSRAPTIRTADDAASAAPNLRARRVPCDVLTLDGTRPGTLDVVRLSMGPESAIRDPAAALARIKQHAHQGLRLRATVRIDSFAAVPRARRQAISADRRAGRPCDSSARPLRARRRARRRRAGAAAGGHHRLDQSRRLRLVAQRARSAVQGRRRRDRERRRRAGARTTRSHSMATRGSVCTTSIRCCTTAACSMPPPSSRRPSRRRR